MRFALAVALQIAVSVSPYRAAFAQTPATPTDSVRRDSLRADTVASDSIPSDSINRPIHPWWGPLIIPVGAVFIGVMAVAPAPLARWVNIGPVDMTFMKDHVALDVSVGGRFAEGETWANALSVELLRSGVHVELRAEDFWRPRHVRYFTARAGYLWHPKAAAAGGLTIGYVHAEGATSRTGLELGLPLFVGRETMTMRFEPTYVISSRGALWSYRSQAEVYVAGGRYVIGATVIKKSVRVGWEEPGWVAPQAVMATLGARF